MNGLQRAKRRLTALARWWQSSLAIRVSSVIVAAGALALLLAGVYVSTSIRDGLFHDRIEQVLADAVWRVEHAQSVLDGADIQSTAQVQRLVYDLIYELRSSSSGTVGVVLMPAQDQQASAGSYVTDRALEDLVTPEMSAKIESASGQLWQSVRVSTSTGSAPGVIVGQRITLPLVGNYDFYTVYSLASEQKTIDLVMGVLAAGAVGLIAVLVAITWLGTWQILRPVRAAAASAERIAAGVLDERMDVRGHDELATLGRTFNQMASSLQEQIGKLEELSRVQRRFVSDVSHELRTPLTTVRMAAEVIYDNRTEFDPVTARSAELLAAQLDRFESLLSDLLEISRFDAGAAVLARDDQDMRPVIEQVVHMAEPLAEERGVKIRLYGMDRPVTADFDPRRIERVIRNLVVNAVEHSDGGNVDITLAANHTAVAVRVLDYGVGMSDDDAAHVFDRFFRADPSRSRKIGGTGLGLSISLEDARLHGGDIQAWGRPGVGASFLLLLPRHAGQEITPPLELRPGYAEARPVPVHAGEEADHE